MPGKSALVYAATPAAVFSVSLPDGAVAPCSRWAAGRRVSPAGLFCREPGEVLLTLAGGGGDAADAGKGAAGLLVQLTRAVLDTDRGGHCVALAAREGLLMRDGGSGSWERAPGCGGVALAGLDFALHPASGARLLVAAGWRRGAGPELLLSRGAMAGAPAAARDFEARRVPGAEAAGWGACLVRVDPSDPQRLYALVVPAPPALGEGGAAWGLWVSPDLGTTWRPLAAGGVLSGMAASGLALCGAAAQPGRLLLTGSADLPAAGEAGGQVAPGADGGAARGRAAVVLYSSDGGATFADLSAAVAAAAEPAAAAARARHCQLQGHDPSHAAHCRQRAAAARAAGPLPLFIHASALLSLPDGQLLFNADPEAAPGSWHAVCQLPGPIAALAADDGLVVIVGSGLAGLVAALEAARAAPQLEVLVLEKNPAVGGNSARASSGVNAVNPAGGDSAALYAGDTRASGGGLSDERLVEVLAASSQDALALLASLGADVSTVVRLGGHSAPRTRCNASGPNIGFALVRAVEAAVRQQPNVRIVTHAKVVSAAYSGDGRLALGVTTQQPTGGGAAGGGAAGGDAVAAAAAAAVTLLADGLVLASGGFAGSPSLLGRYRPDLAGLPTTNGPWASGDGIELGGALGAGLVHMEQVQVHPTGFVDPKDPDSSSKFLAPEKLRGCGALLLDGGAQRFVDELATRDVVAAAVMAQPSRTAWLLLGAEGAEQFGAGTLAFYASKGLLTQVEGTDAAAAHIGASGAALAATIDAYNAAAAAVAAGGGTAGDATGKVFFPSRLACSGPLWLGRVTPVLHYTMGGLAVGPDAAVLGRSGEPLPRVWAAGEVSGGLHGMNRLGGNSLAECAVFGRVAGRAAAAALVTGLPQQARQPLPL
ncbi:MAG: FAD binding domain-containing protein [Monoraphidium minutum]|nr:MAG: FAD binding domain-containing protein [Monoraphidium minutum]